MAVLYITSDRPGAGKTALASSLAERWSQEGQQVGYFKPFSPNPQDDADVEFVARTVLRDVGDTPHPVPLPAAEESGEPQGIQKDTAGELKQTLEKLISGKRKILVEGPALTTNQGDGSRFSVELAGLLDAPVLLIIRYRSGLNADQMVEECEPFGDRLRGVVINSVTRYKEREVRQSLMPAVESSGIKVFGAIPEDRVMLSVTLVQIAQHLEGQWALGQERAEELVENFLIGGNIMDRGDTYFGRMENKAVIVRGDRPDIQLAALSAPTTCLILTGGHQPIQYVYYQAEQQDVPVLVVQADTISTAQALDDLLECSTFHHPRKLERFQELLRQHVDCEAIEAGL